MALTPEQQADLELQDIRRQRDWEREANRREYEDALESIKHQRALELANNQVIAQVASQNRHSKLEAVRLAKETLIENARSKPADARDITADEVKAFAQVLMTYINE